MQRGLGRDLGCVFVLVRVHMLVFFSCFFFFWVYVGFGGVLGGGLRGVCRSKRVHLVCVGGEIVGLE